MVKSKTQRARKSAHRHNPDRPAPVSKNKPTPSQSLLLADRRARRVEREALVGK